VNSQSVLVQTDYTILDLAQMDALLCQLKEQKVELETKVNLCKQKRKLVRTAFRTQITSQQHHIFELEKKNSILEATSQDLIKQNLSLQHKNSVLNETTSKLTEDLSVQSTSYQLAVHQDKILHNQILNQEKLLFQLKSKLKNMENLLEVQESSSKQVDEVILAQLSERNEKLRLQADLAEFQLMKREASPIFELPLVVPSKEQQTLLLELTEAITQTKELAMLHKIQHDHSQAYQVYETHLLKNSSLNNVIPLEEDTYYFLVDTQAINEEPGEKLSFEVEESLDLLLEIFADNTCNVEIQTESIETPFTTSQAIDMLELRELISKLKQCNRELEYTISEKELVIKEKDFLIQKFKDIIDTKDIFMKEYKTLLDGLNFIK
jgi:hypothetical protein